MTRTSSCNTESGAHRVRHLESGDEGGAGEKEPEGWMGRGVVC